MSYDLNSYCISPTGARPKSGRITVTELNKAISKHGRATWVLAGGTSPMAAYQVIAQKYANAVDWRRVYVVMGDERCVPSNHPDSNWRQVKEALLRHIDIPIANQLQPQSGLAAKEMAAQYQTALSILPKANNGAPRLDHVWLGIGEDGHTLSLFPGREASWDNTKVVIAVHDSPKPPPERISLTLRALESIATCLVFMAGKGKSQVVAQARRGDVSLPFVQATRTIESAGGQVSWLLDRAAAGE